MLIEQIIKFELIGPGPPGRTCNPKPSYFHDKIKISRANLRMNYYLQLKRLQKAKYLASPHVGQVTYKFLLQNARLQM